MKKILQAIADMPDTEQEIIDYLLTDLVQLARENFTPQLQELTDTELRMALITIMEYGFLKVVAEENYVQWMLYQPSSNSWIRLPTSKTYLERMEK